MTCVCSPYIIGTMSQTTASSAAAASNLLELHHNFRWVVCSNRAEPGSGLLQRYLRRRLIAAGTGRPRPRARCAGSVAKGDDDDDDDGLMSRVVDWMPRAWQHINNFLQSRSSTTDVTIGRPILVQLFSLLCDPPPPTTPSRPHQW